MKRCLVIDLDRCTGCESCVIGCKYENKVDLGQYWNKVLRVGPMGTWPNISMYWLPMQCQQCANPACVAVCPTSAHHRDEETGVVLIDQELCIGCKSCVNACPWEVPYINVNTNTAQKCTLCFHETKDNPDWEPPCCHNCCGGARFIGDLDDPNSKAAKAVAAAKAKDSSSIHTLKDHAGTQPSTVYILSDKIAKWQPDFSAVI